MDAFLDLAFGAKPEKGKCISQARSVLPTYICKEQDEEYERKRSPFRRSEHYSNHEQDEQNVQPVMKHHDMFPPQKYYK